MKLLLPLLLLASGLPAQVVFDAQQVYDDPGGLYDPDSLRSIHIDFYDSNYHSILVDSFWTNPSYRIPADVRLGSDTLNNVAARYKGNSTFCGPMWFGFPKYPLNLDMNDLVSGQKLMGYKKVKLSNAFPDATFAREYAGSLVYRRYLPTYEVNLMNVHVQGSWLGLYVNTESINKQFLEKHFDEKDGVLVKCDPAMIACIVYTGIPNLSWISADSSDYYPHYFMKSDHGWAEFMTLIETLTFDPAQLDTILNVDRALWNFAVNNCVMNMDSYNGEFIHNYYLYQTEDGLFQMIPWDVSESFVGNVLGNLGGDSAAWSRDPYYSGPSRPLFDSLLAVPLYRKQYTAHMRTIMDESMDSLWLRTRINDLQNLSETWALADTNKPHNNIAFHATVDSSYGGYGGIMSTMQGRKAFLENHPEVGLVPPDIFSVISSGAFVEADVMNADQVDLMATISPHGSRFQTIPMHDDGLDGDILAGDGIWTASLAFFPADTTIKFYVRAQNDDAMRLSPERAEYEYFMTDHSVDITEWGITNAPGTLIRITDILGRDIDPVSTGLQLLLYDNGVVEKRFVSKVRR